MPHLLFLSEDKKEIAKLLNVREEDIKVKGIVLIICEFLPTSTVENEEQVAEKISATYCRPKCGYMRDSQLRGYQIFCFNPQSPYLAEFKKILGKDSNLS